MAKRRGTPRTLEPEAPEMYEAPPKSEKRRRPAPGQSPGVTLDEALASVALTVGVRLIERLLAPSVPTVPMPPMPPRSTMLRTCGGIPETYDRCGARYVPEEWRICPFCGDNLVVVPS